MRIQALLRLKILATQATSKEPVGPALGQLGIPIMDFCNKFNNITTRFLNDVLLNVVVYSYGNQKYDFIVKLPDFFFLFKRCFIKFIPFNKPGYINIPTSLVCYLTTYIIYEVLSYHCINSFNTNLDVSMYKKTLYSLKPCGFLFV